MTIFTTITSPRLLQLLRSRRIITGPPKWCCISHPTPTNSFLCLPNKRCHVTRRWSAAAEADQPPPTSEELYLQVEGDYCMPGDVMVNNDAHPDFTVMTVEVKDYPGLFRVVAWVLNGLDVLVENAEVDTTADGMATQTFWLTNKRGKKLSAKAAELLSERVSDFVVFCTPDQSAMAADRFVNDNIDINNAEDAHHTVLTVLYTREDRNAMLNLAMVLSGIGVQIRKAVIQACAECEDVVKVPEDHVNKNRLFKFWVTDRGGKKLNYDRISSLLYTLGLVMHNSHTSSRPPLTLHTDFASSLEESILYDR